MRTLAPTIASTALVLCLGPCLSACTDSACTDSATSGTGAGSPTASTPVPPSARITPLPPPARTTSSAPAAHPTQRRVGYGVVKIGMSRSELRASGGLADPQQLNDDYCRRWPMAHADGEVVLDPHTRKVFMIEFGPDMSTSKGIRIGSTRGAVEAAYPDLRPPAYAQGDTALESARVTATVHYLFLFTASGHPARQPHSNDRLAGLDLETDDMCP